MDEYSNDPLVSFSIFYSNVHLVPFCIFYSNVWMMFSLLLIMRMNQCPSDLANILALNFPHQKVLCFRIFFYLITYYYLSLKIVSSTILDSNWHYEKGKGWTIKLKVLKNVLYKRWKSNDQIFPYKMIGQSFKRIHCVPKKSHVYKTQCRKL